MRNYLKSAGFFAGKMILKPKLSKVCPIDLQSVNLGQ